MQLVPWMAWTMLCVCRNKSILYNRLQMASHEYSLWLKAPKPAKNLSGQRNYWNRCLFMAYGRNKKYIRFQNFLLVQHLKPLVRAKGRVEVFVSRLSVKFLMIMCRAKMIHDIYTISTYQDFTIFFQLLL